jgi:dTDP-4-dehydrorhamnose reductase
MANKLLITGASGFLGGYLCEHAVKQGFEVHAVGNTRAPASNLKNYRADLSNPLAVSNLVAQVKPSFVIHAAAMAHPAECEKNPEASYQANVLATQYLAKYSTARGAQFIFVSSEQVFSGEALVYRANDAPNPINVYGRHKAQAERLLGSLHSNVIIARLPLLYSFSHDDAGFAQAMMQAFKQGQEVQAFTDEIRPPAHVDDIAQALVKLVTIKKTETVASTGQHFPIVHLGGPQALTRFEMAQQLAQHYAQVQGLPTASVMGLLKPVLQSIIQTGVARPARLWLESQSTWSRLGLQPRTWSQALSELVKQTA